MISIKEIENVQKRQSNKYQKYVTSRICVHYSCAKRDNSSNSQFGITSTIKK